MPKAPRHRKRVRAARDSATAQPLGAAAATAAEDGSSSSTKKVGKKEAEVTNLLDKLRSDKVEDRTWAASALANLMPTLPLTTQRLLLSNNLIGLLIERLNDPDPTVSVECLGALRNLAVSSPTSIVSEMHNKRLLLPLTTTHLPQLGSSSLRTELGPAPEPLKPSLPASPAQRQQVDEQNAVIQAKRRLYWDWSENVLTLVWCLAESTTKILGSLNNHAKEIVECSAAYLDARALGLVEGANGAGDGMDVEGAKKGAKSKTKKGSKTDRVPLFVAVTAAQALHAFISSNPSSHAFLLTSSDDERSTHFSSLLTLVATSAPPAAWGKTARTESHAASTPESDAEDFAQLRVLAFGILLELIKSTAKGKGKGRAWPQERDEIREVLKANQSLLVGLVGTDLDGVSKASREVLSQMDPKMVEAPGASSTSGHALKLASYERQLSTLQLSLEVLGEWCSTVDAESMAMGSGVAADEEEDEEEEEWAGIQGQEDVEMDDEDDDAEVIISKPRPEDLEDTGMLEDDDDEETKTPKLSDSALSLFAQLPTQLLRLARPTDLSFLPSAAASPTTNGVAAGATHSAPSTLLNGATTPSPPPQQLAGIADILTTIHVRALECLNNLFITLARSSGSSAVSDAQQIWEATLELVQAAGQASSTTTVVKEDEMDEVEQRRMEVVGAGVGALWGMARVAFESGQQSLKIDSDTSPFLIELFNNHPFAQVASPAGEAVRVRIAGTLGWIGRRKDVPAEENEMIGLALLAVLPLDAKTPSPLNPTPEILLQAIDSVIDLYADEDASYDVAVFRQKHFLSRLQAAVPGVRAAVKKIDRKKYPELRLRADGALENLVAFVDYRRQFEP